MDLVGNRYRVDIAAMRRRHDDMRLPAYSSMLRSMIRRGNGKVTVIRQHGDDVDVAVDRFDAIMGTVTLPVKYLVI